MNSLHGRAAKRNISKQITINAEFSNLFAELPAVPRVPATAAGAHLHQRYHVSAGIADVVAELNGLGIEEARR